MLLGFLALYFRSGDVGGERTFDIVRLSELGAQGAFSGSFAFWVFFALFLGFAVKVPMWPLHTWLPDAHNRRSHCGLGAAGRHPPEAGLLRLHPHQPADPAAGGGALGPGHRGAGGDRHSSTGRWPAWPSPT